VKDLRTQSVITRCNSSGDLYPLSAPLASTATPSVLLASAPSQLWHRRLGHIGRDALHRLASLSYITCNKDTHAICHACQLGRHVRLPFSTSQSRALHNFDLVHCDLWTSPIPSVSGYKYYLVILDDCSHYLWTFPLRLKSDTFPTIAHFFSFVATQFGTTIKNLQCDNVVSSTIPTLEPSFFHMVSTFGCRVPTPPNKMVAPNVSYAPSTT
jgi:hypothetical protein